MFGFLFQEGLVAGTLTGHADGWLGGLVPSSLVLLEQVGQ